MKALKAFANKAKAGGQAATEVQPLHQSPPGPSGRQGVSMHAPQATLPIMGKQQLSRDQLCGICAAIDFDRLLTSATRDIKIGTVKHVVASQKCPLCRIVYAALRERLGDDPLKSFRPDQVAQIVLGSRKCYKESDSGKESCAYQISIDLTTEIDSVSGRYITQGVSYIDAVDYDLSRKYGRRSYQAHCDLRLLRSWIDSCGHRHDHSQYREPFDQRLIREGRLRGLDVDTLKLTSMQPTDRYFSLSYVCGDITQTALAARVFRSGGRDIYVEHAKLPRVIQDALWLTKQFGVQYLWIDCLSIIQDDPIDKAFLILNMNAIYERSALTIISAAGKGLDASLPGITPREPAAIKPAALESIPHRQKPINIALVAYSAQNLLTRTAWATRGWCYQEHVLSPRCLCFTPTECFFTCDDGLWREAYSTNGEFRSTIKGQIVHGNERRSAKTVRGKQAAPVATFEETRLIYPLSNAKADVSFPEYCEAVYDYTGRELTWKTDVFNAFAGMLATFGSGTPPYHCMPLSVFEHALCWQEAGDSEKLKPGSSDLPRALAVKRDPAQVIDLKSKKVIATETIDTYKHAWPTWSWAYWTAPITYADEICEGYLGLFNFVQHSPELIVGTPRKIPKWFKRRGHGDRGHGTLYAQHVEELPLPGDLIWRPCGSAPQPSPIPISDQGRPTVLLIWTRLAKTQDGYEALISAWKEYQRGVEVVLKLKLVSRSHFERVGIEHQRFQLMDSAMHERERLRSATWRWVAIR